MVKTLDEIARQTQPGKSGLQLGYSFVYDLLFRDRREKVSSVLEIGILKGASLRMWEEYFPNANIHGIDIHTYDQYPDGKFSERTRIYYADQNKSTDLLMVMNVIGGEKFDMISDDGSHETEHQITSLNTLFPFLKDDGLYIIEDIRSIDEIKPFLKDYNHWFAFPNDDQPEKKNYGAILAIIQK